MPQRPIILFDVMETLVTEPFFDELPGFFGMTLDQLVAANHPTAWIEFEKGLITEAEYLSRFFIDGRHVDGDGLRRHLREAYRWIDGMEDLLAQLKSSGFRIHALSNYSIWYEMIDQKLRLSRFLDWSFVSCRTGLRKPDAQAYLHAATALRVNPGDCLFIDDRDENVQAATATGMDAIRMTGCEDVRKELRRRNLMADGP